MSNKPTVCCVMIVKNEEETLERCLESVKSICNEFVIVDTGSIDSTKEIIQKYGKLYEEPFVNFVVTKNKALQYAWETENDYILWMDADEYFLPGQAERLYNIIVQNPEIPSVTTDINDIIGDDNIATAEYTRQRIWRRDLKFEFAGPGIHEYIDNRMMESIADRQIKVQHKHKTKGKDYDGNSQFYIKTMSEWLESHPNDLRALFYLGETYRYAGHCRISNEYYLRYLTLPNTFRDEMYWASYCIAQNYYAMQEVQSAYDELDRTISIDSRRAEAYFMKGLIKFWLEEWEECIEFLETALHCNKMPDIIHFIEKDKYEGAPLDYLAIAYEKVGRLEDAYEATKTLSLLNPKDERLENNKNFYWSKIHPTVVFYMGWSQEPLYPAMLDKQGLGGIETCNIQLAEAMASFGWNVIIFGNIEKEFKHNLVNYIHFELYPKMVNSINGPKTVITSRNFNSAFSELENTDSINKIIWLQDPVSDKDVFSIDQSKRVYDKIVVSSHWHKQQLLTNYRYCIRKENIIVIPLTIDKKYYVNKVEKVPYRIIYTSSPNRGLSNLLHIWPALTQIFPKAELHLFYGWDTLKMYLPEDRWKPHYDLLMESLEKYPNIIDHGKVTKAQLAVEQQKAQLCIFPNNATETFCLTALELTAAGTPMVYTSVGAMKETVYRDANIDLQVNTNSYAFTEFGAEQYIKEVTKLFREVNQTRLKRWSQQLRNISNNFYSWRDVASFWKDQIIFKR